MNHSGHIIFIAIYHIPKIPVCILCVLYVPQPVINAGECSSVHRFMVVDLRTETSLMPSSSMKSKTSLMFSSCCTRIFGSLWYLGGVMEERDDGGRNDRGEE